MNVNYEYVISRRRIPEIVVPGKRLGRHVRHDSRSLRYRYRTSGAPLKTELIERYIPILNQGDVGACTGNAEVGALGTGPLYVSLPISLQDCLDEQEALDIYSLAEDIDGDGPYPPNDNGSCGLSAAQAAKQDGFISGYTHCLTLTDVLDAISDGNPVTIGSNWYTSFDTPNSNGLVSIAPGATVRGGHEYLARGINVESQLIFCDNSWGTSYGDQGSFTYSWDTLAQLLEEQGDGTVPVAINQPAPVPVVTP